MSNYYQLLLTVNNWKTTVNQRVVGSSPTGGAKISVRGRLSVGNFPTLIFSSLSNSSSL